MDPYVGQLALVGFNFAPVGWALCSGQLLSLSQNTALFSLLGTTYGGDGRSTFGLPDLRGRIPVGVGQGPGLTLRDLGESGGEEAHLLLIGEMPAHNHTVAVSGSRGSALTTPVNNFLGEGHSIAPYAPGTSPLNQTLQKAVAQPAGQSHPHENRAPYLALNWIIALQGVFPPRS